MIRGRPIIEISEIRSELPKEEASEPCGCGEGWLILVAAQHETLSREGVAVVRVSSMDLYKCTKNCGLILYPPDVTEKLNQAVELQLMLLPDYRPPGESWITTPTDKGDVRVK